MSKLVSALALFLSLSTAQSARAEYASEDWITDNLCLEQVCEDEVQPSWQRACDAVPMTSEASFVYPKEKTCACPCNPDSYWYYAGRR